MILFKKIRYKNFLSTGNYFNEVILDNDKTTLIVGQNGSGKSSMLDAISYALFGKAHRNISKDQLVNSINKKNCVVEVEFIIGKSFFKIIRGIKPNIFEIWKDDVFINQSSHAREYQKILEQNILKLNHKSFHQVVVLGSSSFIPFMQLATNNRRNVIDDILDINVFTKMSLLLRERNSTVKDQNYQINSKIEINNNKIATQKKYINDVKVLTNQNIDSKNKQVEESRGEIEKLQETNKITSADLERLVPQNEKLLKEKHDSKNSCMHDKARIQNEISSLVKNAKFYEINHNCPTCEQSISDKMRDEKIQSAKDDARHLASQLKEVEEYASEVNDQIDIGNENAKKYNKWQSTVTSNNTEIDRLNKFIKNTLNEIANSSTNDLVKARADLDVLDKEKLNLTEKKLELSEQVAYNNVIGEMLKDTGIKTKVIKQYLPVINNLVNQYLSILDFYVHFNLDEAFVETIRSRHRDDFTYDSFSEGEKQRIDLSLLFTWRQIAKMKNSVSTNLLLLDETFDSSLDHDGVENLLKILNTLSQDTNIFVISHKGEILDNKFNSKIEFIKEKNFSKMKINS